MSWPAAAGASFPGPNGQIVYDARGGTDASGNTDHSSGDHIWTVNPNGTCPTQLTHGDSRNANPDWSPDGTRIVFDRSTDPTNSFAPRRLWTMDADGSNEQQLTTTASDDAEPAWSPDGTKIALSRNSGSLPGGGQITVINANGTGAQTLTSDGRWPQWSPDGTKLAYIQGPSMGNPGDKLVVISSADGSGEQVLTPPSADPNAPAPNAGFPSWSPDGTKIAFEHQVPGSSFSSFAVFVVNANGTNMHPISPNGDWAGVAWSPDGTKIIGTAGGTSASGHSGYFLWEMAPDGSGFRSLTSEPLAVIYVVRPGWGQRTMQLTCSLPFPPPDVPDLPAGSPLSTLSPPVADSPPGLSAIRAFPATFVLGSRLPTVRSAVPVGTAFRFSLTEPARVTFRFQIALPGRRIGRRCRASTRARRRRPRCTRYLNRGSFNINARRGQNVVRFSGRLTARRWLRPGRYRMLTHAVDRTRHPSRQRTTRLRVLARVRRIRSLRLGWKTRPPRRADSAVLLVGRSGTHGRLSAPTAVGPK